MALTKVRKKIYYRKAVFAKADGSEQFELQDILKTALTNNQNAEMRRYQVVEEENTYCLINYWGIAGVFLFCQVLMYDQGSSQALMTYDDKTQRYNVSAIQVEDLQLGNDDDKNKTPKEGDAEGTRKNTEFVNSMMYFGVWENKVIFMPSQAIDARLLERYLNWFIANIAKKVNCYVSLVEAPGNKFAEIIKTDPIKNVEIGLPIDPKADYDINENTYKNIKEINLQQWIFGGMMKKLIGKVPADIGKSVNLKTRVILAYDSKLVQTRT